MKKLTCMLLCACMLLALLPVRAAGAVLDIAQYDEASQTYQSGQAEQVTLLLDGRPLSSELPAMLVKGRTLVPVRALAEALGAEVIWVPDTRQAILRTVETTIVLTLGSAKAVVNGQEMELPDGVPAAKIRYGDFSSTMAPLRFVAEQLGAAVDWNAAAVTASITRPAAPGAAAVTGIRVDGAAGTVLIASAAAPKYVVTDLVDRVAVDVLDASLPSGAEGTKSQAVIQVGSAAISSVRYLQHGAEFLQGSEHTLRVVLDLPEGSTFRENVTIASTDGGILLTVTPPKAGAGDPGGTETPEFEYTAPKNPGHYTIAIDPGHGGDHFGAMYEGIPEKTINLAVARLLRDRLQELGYRVVMTIDGDDTLGLYERCDIANEAGADIFISVHSNASSTSSTFQGLFTYYHPSSNRGKKLAQTIQTPVCQVTGATDRGILSADFVVVRETSMAAVLVEMGFMSTHEELMRLVDAEYQRKLAYGIAEGAVRYLNGLGT